MRRRPVNRRHIFFEPVQFPQSVQTPIIMSQPHGMSGLTSHRPSLEPPQGPFISFLEQRVTGQTAPKWPSLHCPQPRQFSCHTPLISVSPMKSVSSAGIIGLSVIDPGQSLHTGAASQRKDHLVLRHQVSDSLDEIVHALPVQARFGNDRIEVVLGYDNLRAAARSIVSRCPPAAHSATHESQPTTNIDDIAVDHVPDFSYFFQFRNDHGFPPCWLDRPVPVLSHKPFAGTCQPEPISLSWVIQPVWLFATGGYRAEGFESQRKVLQSSHKTQLNQ